MYAFYSHLLSSCWPLPASITHKEFSNQKLVSVFSCSVPPTQTPGLLSLYQRRNAARRNGSICFNTLTSITPMELAPFSPASHQLRHRLKKRCLLFCVKCRTKSSTIDATGYYQSTALFLCDKSDHPQTISRRFNFS